MDVMTTKTTAKAGIIAGATAQKSAEMTTEQILRKTMMSAIDKMAPAIKAALPSVITPERFSRIAISAISTNPKLAACTTQSFLGAMMTAAQLGLECNTPLGQGYLIPRNTSVKKPDGTWSKEMRCSFELGYKGLIDLAYRSGEITSISAQTVYENDEFDYEFGLEPKLRHKPALSDRGAPIYYYAVYHTKTGGYGFEVMSDEDVRAHARKYSESFKGGTSSPWQTSFEEMAKKTVLKRVLKYAPLSTGFHREMAQDETVHSFDETTSADELLDAAEFIEADGTVEEAPAEEPANV
jgi:recombination protein RecT